MILLNSVSMPLVTDLLIIFLISIILIVLCNKAKLPSIVGFLLTGVLCSTNGLNFHFGVEYLPDAVAEFITTYIPKHAAPPEEDVETLAEIGVIMLLFTIGLEFSIANLMKIKKAVFLGGSLQVLLTMFAFGALVYFTSYDYLPIAIFMGMLFALSSTAIVLKILSEKGEIGQPHGQVVLAILIFQDIAVVPMMLLVPIMASGDFSGLGLELLIMTAKLAGILIVMFVLGKYVIPFVLYHIASVKSNDLFIITVLVICFAIAYITGLAGLSFALGAFMAGLVVSETKYGHHAISTIIAFKELFTSIFFISVGLLMDLSFVFEHVLEILSYTVVILFLKTLVGIVVVMVLKEKLKTVISAALGISQIGEFSFVLSKMGEEFGLMPIELYQYFLSVAVSTMIITPILMNSADSVVVFLTRSKWIPKKMRRLLTGVSTKYIVYNMDKFVFNQYLIIAGFNLTGRTLAYGAKEMGIPFVVIEDNAQIVEAESKKGTPIIFGNAASEEILKHIKVADSAAIIITSEEEGISIPIIHAVKSLMEKPYIIARSHTIKEAEKLKHHGASEVITDEMEVNMSMLVQVMDYLEISTHEAYKFSSYIKALANEAGTNAKEAAPAAH